MRCMKTSKTVLSVFLLLRQPERRDDMGVFNCVNELETTSDKLIILKTRCKELR